jgi:membrane protease YdiL (CAAX protease family)
MTAARAVGFPATVWLLLKAARQRSVGRRGRQRELLNYRSGRNAIDWGSLAVIVGALFAAIVHGAAAFALISAVTASQRLQPVPEGKFVVSASFYDWVHDNDGADWSGPLDESINEEFREEATRIVNRRGGDVAVTERELKAAVVQSGSRQLISDDRSDLGLAHLAASGQAGAIFGSAVFLWWFAMVVCQGEGLELDLQRRRHPMWEWLLSHPVGAGAVFFAEMLTPLAVNPIYWSAPLFIGILYGFSENAGAGFAAAFLIGIPLTIAAACAGKALEIGAILRLPVRNRGAAIGIMSWFGYASMVAMFFGSTATPWIVETAGRWINAGGSVRLSLLGLVLGQAADGQFSFLRGMLFCWAASIVVVALAVTFSARSIRNGLSGAFASDRLPARKAGRASFGRDPLYRKEYLWFARDRSAVVQTILIPLTVAGFQLFNMRGILKHAEDSWNYLSGAAIFFGTYFLWILGPKSLTSEGSALWIALTWPRGLESVLKAKAWLWAMIASALVSAVLLAACWLFPTKIWMIALVAIGWFVFARSMAEKSVTLITVVSESGEAQPVPSGRRWAAQLGMLTFAIGICTEQWNLAIVGVVYSWITAAAMWENFRARLPYLYDPWSEELPKPPTLMHAMVAISILIECASVLTGIVYGFTGKAGMAAAQAIGYAVCAVAVSIGVSEFLSGRGVSPSRIWCWRDEEPADDNSESWIQRYIAANRGEARWLFYGLGGGLLLALLAHVYLTAVTLIPAAADIVHASEHQMQTVPGLRAAYAIIGIGFAPFAEEYLFRGLVFRTLDQQWGGKKAILGAAAFFAIYHPPLAWVPVALVGAVNCLLFKKSGRLAPAVLLHMAYNSVVILWT